MNQNHPAAAPVVASHAVERSAPAIFEPCEHGHRSGVRP